MANYTEEQNAFVKTYQSQNQAFDDTKRYVFIMKDITPSRPLSGFMPLGRQVGFVFTGGDKGEDANETKQGNIAITLAHELGHGVYQIQHPWEQLNTQKTELSTNSWLMSYGQGIQLPYIHWEQISHPKFIVPIFKSDESGEMAGGDLYNISITTKAGEELFALKGNKTYSSTTMTIEQLYKKGVQWFEPLADNYLPLKSQTKKLSVTDKVKHFTSEQILNFADQDRWMISYVQGGTGDWKASKDGADGFLLVTVDEIPYWADAIGQIPFAVDYSTDMIKEGKSIEESIKETVKKGREYGEGKLIGGKIDNTNTYDNYFILRGAINGTTKREITKPITKEEAKKYGL